MSGRSADMSSATKVSMPAERRACHPVRCVWIETVIVVAALAIAPKASLGADVRISVSTYETFVGSPIQIDVTIENAKQHEMPVFPTVDGAEVLESGSSTRSFVSITLSGRVKTETTTYSYIVIPRRAGVLTIPPIIVAADGESFSAAVGKIVVKTSETGDLLFLKIVSERDSIYVGEPLTATLELWIKKFTAGNITLEASEMWSGAVDERSSSWGAFAKNLERGNRNVRYREDRHPDENGVMQRYIVFLLKNTVWPERTGVFDGGDIHIVVKYPLRVRRNRFRLLGGRYEIMSSRPVSASLPESRIIVKAPPRASQPENFNGAVGQYTLSVSAAPTQVSVGDPITITLAIRGTGRLEQLRAPSLAKQQTLTTDFRVPDEPLAGTVSGGVKKFSQSIRAKHDSVTEIPPIEFSFFDPRTERYRTLLSDPIPLTVKESTRLAVSQMVEGNGLSGTLTELTLSGSGLLANYDDVEALLSQQAVSLGPGTWGVAAAGPLVCSACVLIRRRRERYAGDQGWSRRRSARRTAMAALTRDSRGGPGGSGAVAARIAGAVTGYVADRCNLPPAAMTRADAVAQLRMRNMPETLIDQADVLLAKCEASRYGAVQHGGEIDTIEQARNLVDELDRRKL